MQLLRDDDYIQAQVYLIYLNWFVVVVASTATDALDVNAIEKPTT